MSIPNPEAGLVISYAYLWHTEHQAGQEEGRKDRPTSHLPGAALVKIGPLRVLTFDLTLYRYTCMERGEPRLSYASLKVLRAFLDSPTQQLSGADIHKLAQVHTGTLYPILLRLEAVGWLDSEWEKVDPREVKRPRKRFYWLTKTGLNRASEALCAVSRQVVT
jgi:PadR family transcriptional regulator, regulatory protein PadR